MSVNETRTTYQRAVAAAAVLIMTFVDSASSLRLTGPSSLTFDSEIGTSDWWLDQWLVELSSGLSFYAWFLSNNFH